MKAWIIAKTSERHDEILEGHAIPLTHNVSEQEMLAHVSLTPFLRGRYALDVIGAETNEAWIFELEIPDVEQLMPDPSGEGRLYGGDWRVSRNPIPIDKVLNVLHIPDVLQWEEGLE